MNKNQQLTGSGWLILSLNNLALGFFFPLVLSLLPDLPFFPLTTWFFQNTPYFICIPFALGTLVLDLGILFLLMVAVIPATSLLLLELILTLYFLIKSWSQISHRLNRFYSILLLLSICFFNLIMGYLGYVILRYYIYQ